MTPTPKRPRSQGRLSQLSKRQRLVRRKLGQWVAAPQSTRSSPTTRYSLAEAEFKEGV